MNIICIIPARGGSKGIPRKNITLLGNKPLISYTIETALKTSKISQVIVSTDDQEIANVAKKYGADTPFLRPKELASDQAKDIDVIKHLILWYEQTQNNKIDMLVYLRPTTPFKKPKTITNCIDKATQGIHSSIRTVSEAEGINHPYWMFKGEDGVLKPFINGISTSKYYQRQLLPQCFHLNGVVDIIFPENVLKGDMWGPNMGYVISEYKESIDIDTANDLEYCEFLIQKKRYN